MFVDSSQTKSSALGAFTSTPNVFTAPQQFNAKFGVNGLGTQSLTDPTVPSYFYRSDLGVAAGVDCAVHAEYITAFTNTVIGVGILGDVIDTGSAVAGGGHIVGVIGRAQIPATSGMPGFGIEGRSILRGTNDNRAALNGICDYIGTTFTGRFANVYQGFCEIFQSDGSTALNQGTTCVYRAFAGTGGDPTLKYALYGDGNMQIFTGGKITSSNAAGGKTVAIFQDGTDGWLQSSSGTFRIDPGTGNYVTIQQGLGFAHLAGGTLGHPSFPWGQFYSSTYAANGSVATSLGSVGPVGSHTTVQKWWQINDGTNNLYVPLF